MQKYEINDSQYSGDSCNPNRFRVVLFEREGNKMVRTFIVSCYITEEEFTELVAHRAQRLFDMGLDIQITGDASCWGRTCYTSSLKRFLWILDHGIQRKLVPVTVNGETFRLDPDKVEAFLKGLV
jgi:hypothetical protein